MLLESEPLPSLLGHLSPLKHQCSSISPCVILLSEIGKHYHMFPRGSFQSCFTPPAVPQLVLHYFDAHLFHWSWTMKNGPNASKSFAIPTIPTSCPKDSLKAVRWTVSIFHAFKSQLTPKALDLKMGRVLPAYVKLYQNNMLMHFHAQHVHPWAGISPCICPPSCCPPASCGHSSPSTP